MKKNKNTDAGASPFRVALLFALFSSAALLFGASVTMSDDDPDMPSVGVRMDKSEYIRLRNEHVNKLRGVRAGKPADPSARARAIEQLNRQEARAADSIATTSIDASTGEPMADESSQTGAEGLAPLTPGMPSSGTIWSSIGPNPLPNGQTFNTNNVAVSGRVVAIAIHPTNGNIAYVGAAQGGVYRTLDGGATWTPLMDNAQTLSIGAIAISPSQPSTIYIGTGEGNFSGDCFFGVGIYRIDNADGANPVLTGPLNKDANGNDVLSGWGMDKIIVHPTDPNTIFFGTTSGIGGISGLPLNDTTATSTKPRGLFRSTNAAGANPTFQRLSAATDNGGNLSVTDVEFEPGNPSNVLATVRGTSIAGSGGVYRSTNALAANPTFTRTLAVGSSSTLTRTEIAINKVGSQVTVFAATTDSSGTLKRSTDGGVTWSAVISGATGFCGGQCDYDMPMALDPTNANVLYLGGPGDGSPAHILIKSTNALAGTPTFSTVQTGLHADEHAVEIDPSNTNIVWTGNDGGLFKSTNAASSWTSLNNSTFVATQFQSLALHSTDSSFMIGGTQDNGTECLGQCGTFSANSWNQADYGDGGFSLIDQSQTSLTTLNMYHTYYNQTNTLIGYAYVTSTANAKFVSSPTSDSWSFNGTGGSQTCTSGGGYSCSEAVEFYMPMALGPGSPNPVYTGTDRLHRAATPGASNTTVSQTFVSGVPISAIGISRQNDSVRIVGMDNGKVFRTMTAQTSGWPDVTGSIPAGYISRAVIDPNDQNTAYVTLSAYLGGSTSHIYKTTNLSAGTPTWTGIDGGQIPDVPINAFVVDPSNSQRIYAGTDIGVYRSLDGGTTWTAFSNGLPRVAVFDMAIQNPNRVLRVATHGRGIWEISLASSGTLQGTITDSSNSAPISGAIVTAGSNSTTTNASGFYQMTVVTGTYTVSASAQGYLNNSASNVSVTDNATTTQNISLTPAPANGCFTDAAQADFQGGVTNNVDLTSSPGDVKLAAGAGTLDQQMTNTSTSGNAITTTTWEGQTFIAAIAGQLTQLDADMFCSGCSGTNPDITIEVRTTLGGLPTSTVLASTTITGFSSGSIAFYSATFSNPATLNTGTTYAIVARLLTNRTTGTYAFVRSSNNQYSNGAQVISSNSGSSWSAQNTDLGFKTYMSTGFVSSGDFTSATKDSNPKVGGTPQWTTLSWTGTTPTNTTLKFQAAGTNSATGPFNFVGPDGTSATFFTTSGASLSQFNGFRYLKYKAYLSTTNSSATPTLNDATACFNNLAPGVLQGTVTDASTNSPLSGATVNYSTNSTTTNASGFYQFTNVTPGTYSMSASKTGYVTGSASNVLVSAGGTATQNFALDPVPKQDQTINFPTISGKTYGDADFNPGATASSGLAVTYSATGQCTIMSGLVHITGAGSCSVTASQAGNSDYNAAPDVSQPFAIAKANANITVTPYSVSYDANSHTATGTATGVSIINGRDGGSAGGIDEGGAANLSGLLHLDGTTHTAAGDYHDQWTFDGDSNYNASSGFVDDHIGRVNATWTTNANSKTYGDTDPNPLTTGSGSGFVASDNVTASYSRDSGESAGSYHITATLSPSGALSNYNITNNGATFTINKKNATWTTNNNSKTYGDADPDPLTTGSGSGFAATDNVTASYARDPGSNVGDYHITATLSPSSVLGNYNITNNGATFTINKKNATWTTNNNSKTYGDTDPSPLTTGSGSGFLLADNVTASYSRSAGESAAGSPYHITATLSPSGVLANYNITNAGADFTISKKDATWTTNPNSKTYGAADPNPLTTGSGSGFLAADNVTASYSRAAGETVAGSPYHITATLSPSAAVANYNITNAGADFTINRAHLTVTADNKAKDYDGSAYSPFTATIAGFVNGDTAAVVSGTASFSGTAITATNAGNYTITPAQGTLSAANYDFTPFVNGTLTINKVHLTVTADNKAKDYDGSAFSPFTATITGFVNGEGSAVVTGSAAFSGNAVGAVNAGTYTITPTLGNLSATNYDFPAINFKDGTLTINKKDATWTTDPNGKTYGDPDPSPLTTGSGNGFVPADNVTATYSRVAGETVAGGPYHITATLSTTGSLNNYNITNNGASFTIGKRDATWTTNDNSKTYGAADPTPLTTGSGSNFVASDNVTASYSRSAGESVAGGPYHITATLSPTAALANYNVTNTGANFTISKAHLTVTADNKSKTYDGSTYSPFTATLSGFVNGESASVVSGSAGFTGNAITALNAGTYTITPDSGSLSAANYDFTTFVDGTLTIYKVHLTVKADNKSKTYDGSAFSPFTATITGFVNGESAGVVSGAPTFGGNAATAVNAGTYTITPSIGTLSATNYDFPSLNFIDGTLSIYKVHLAVTADNKSKTYDGVVYSPFTVTITGFVNNEDSSIVTGAPLFSGSATTATDAGTYTITPSIGTLSALNYDFPSVNFFDGTLRIYKKHLSVTADDKSRIYGAANPTFTATLSGFITGETDAGLRTANKLGGTPTFSGTGPSSTATTAIGDYTITPAAGTLTATNYDFPAGNFVDGTLHITKAHLTVTADNKSKAYNGAVFSPFTATISGFVNGENATVVTGSASFTGNATTAVNAGTYTITPTAGTLSATNYDFPNMVNGTLSIYKAHLTVTADNKSKTYDGATFTAFTSTLSGFVNGETDAGLRGSGALSGYASYTGAATTAKSAGSYVITPQQSTLTATNYDFPNMANGTLSIYKAHLTVTADNKSKVYNNQPFTAFTATFSGFVNSETDAGLRTAGTLTGNAQYTGNAIGATAVGTYTITPTAGSLSATNYDFPTMVNGTLSITKSTLTVTADNKSRQYSDPNPTLTYTITGFASGDTVSVVTGSAVLSTTATSTSVQGTYPITVAQGTLAAANYSFAFVNGTLTVTLENASMQYTGDTLQSPSKAGGSATVNLAALITEEADGNLGNTLGGKSITFYVYGSNNSLVATVTGTVSSTNRTATASVSLKADNYMVQVQLVSNNQYTAEMEDAVVTVVDPGTGLATGGGWVNDPEGSRGNFGFTVKYVGTGTPQGNNLYIYRKTMDLAAMGISGAPSGVRPYNVVFKSNAMSALTTKTTTSPKTATFTGKNTIKAIDRVTGVSYNLSPLINYSFQVDVTDKADPSTPTNPDSYAMRVWTTTGNYKTIGTYNSNSSNATQLPLQGGNVQVK